MHRKNGMKLYFAPLAVEKEDLTARIAKFSQSTQEKLLLREKPNF